MRILYARNDYVFQTLLDKNPEPTEEEIRWGISGNLCRCTGYQNIVKAVQYASNKLQETATEGGE